MRAFTHHLQRLCGHVRGLSTQCLEGAASQGWASGESWSEGKILLVLSEDVCFRLSFVMNMLCVCCVHLLSDGGVAREGR